MAQPALPQLLELALVLEVEQFPIAGTLQQPAIAAQPFDGWLELIAAIETALKNARGHATTEQRQGQL
jgi:hypothetical protein